MINLLKKLYPLHRTLASDDTDKAYVIIKNEIPKQFNPTIHEYQPNSKVWYWKVPKRYKVNHAILKDEDGYVYADFSKNPLYLWSYSVSTKKTITFEELEFHLYYSKTRLDAIAWRFKYYDKTWGFCVPYNIYKTMPRDKKYIVDIDVEFLDSPGFRVMDSLVDYGCEKEFVICTNICHPYQVNDSISGLVVAVELQKRFALNPIKNPTHNINFLYCPETIGSITYLANNENKIAKTTGGVFTEMVGHKADDSFILQRSLQKDSLSDMILEYVLKNQNKKYFLRNFQRWNDEGIFNSYGVDIPMVFLMKGSCKYLETIDSNNYRCKTKFYKEYHTSDDNPDIISKEKLQETADVLEEFIRIYCTNYIPIQKEKGIIFFSGLGMHTAIEDNRKISLQLEKLSYMLNGEFSVFDIANILDIDYWEIKCFIDKLFKKGAVEKCMIKK